MEQKKKKQEDVLVVRDEKTGEISVVAGLDARGYPKRAQAKAEHSQEFLRFDRHGDAIDNFMRNFYRQCKEPTRFGFYRVAADTVEALLPVIKDLLKDPVANADLLAPHKVDTSAYQQAEEQQAAEEAKKENAETETEEQQTTEEAKRENAETEAEEQQTTEEAKRENAETEAEEQQTTEEVKRENAETEAEEQQAAEEVKRENAETETEKQQAAEEAKKENGETETEEQQAAEEAKKENAETEAEEQQVAEEAKREDAETETEGQQAAEEVKRENTEENNVEQKTDEKMEEMKQKNQEQQPQAAETQTAQGQQPAQEGQAQAKPEKPNLIADSDVDWKELEQFGVKRENLSEKDMKALEKDMKALMNYGKTRLVTVEPVLGGERYELQARLSLQKAEDGKLKLTPHFVRHEPRLDVPYNGYTFTDEDKQALKQTGNLGKLVNVADTKTGEMRLAYVSIDRLTNEIVDVPTNKVRIPNRIGLTELSKAEQEILRAGLALPKEVTLKGGRKFEAMLQVNADKRDVEFVPEHLWQGQSQRRGNGQEKKQKSPEAPDATGQQQKEDGNLENGQRRNRSWTNEDGSIRPIGKWKDDKFTEQQKADYVAGKVVVLANAKDDKGQPCTKYLKFDREKGRPLTYSENPDLAQTVAPSNESRTQLAVNNEGKTNEATRHVKEPLQQGQTAPKDDTQKQQQEKPKKSKGMKVS